MSRHHSMGVFKYLQSKTDRLGKQLATYFFTWVIVAIYICTLSLPTQVCIWVVTTSYYTKLCLSCKASIHRIFFFLSFLFCFFLFLNYFYFIIFVLPMLLKAFDLACFSHPGQTVFSLIHKSSFTLSKWILFYA